MESFVPLLVIGCIIWWIARRKKKRPQLQVEVKGTSRPNTQAEDRVSELHRQATIYKNDANWDKAIACLREAEKLKCGVETIYPIKHALRLPLFLQQGGYFNEAMAEFQKLLDGTEDRVLSWLPKRNISSKTMLIHADLMNIYQSMSTSCKREKLQALADEYAELAEEHKSLHMKLLKAEQTRNSKSDIA